MQRFAYLLAGLVLVGAWGALRAEEDGPQDDGKHAAPANIPPAPTSNVVHKAGDIVIEPATIDVAVGKVEYELGTFYVPENRSDPKSRVIGIGFARIKATKQTGAPPTFHLPGGPGNSYLSMLKGVINNLLRFRVISDVVIVDQRGFSDRGEVLKFSYKYPDEPLDQPGSIGRSTAAFVEMSKAAVADYAKNHPNVDLKGYTAKECAADVNDLRKALGYEKIQLVGISYGSQWSFATMRLFPEIVARAMLSGVEPLNDGYDMPTLVMEGVKRQWKVAEADKGLAPYIPEGGLEAAAKAVLKRFETPIKVTVKDKSGAEVTVTLGKEDVQRDLLHRGPDGPAWLLSLYHQHYDAWALSVIGRRRAHQAEQKMIGPLIDTSLGVTPEREKQLRSDPATEFLGQWNWDAYIASKDIWPTDDVGDDFRTPVKTEIPVLFLQGDWDINTPVENTLNIAKSFTHSKVLICEHGGHGTIEGTARNCPKEWVEVLKFVETGELPTLPEKVTFPLPKFPLPDFPAPTK